VSEVCRFLEANGFKVSYIPVDDFGIVDPQNIEKAILPSTILVTVMHANNETGVIQPIEKIAEITKKHGVLFHSDAAQSIGKIETDIQKLGVDLLSVAGHKFYAPKGVGALFISRGVKLQKLIHGANHEQNLRAGTENVLEIVGLGKAAEVAKRDFQTNIKQMMLTRDKLASLLFTALPNIRLNGHPDLRLPNTLSISFPNIEANTLLSELKGIAASAGAACHADQIDVSKVLTAMRVPVDFAMGTIRFSTGKNSTIEDMEKAAELIIAAVKRLSPDEVIQDKTKMETNEIKLTDFTHGLGCACKIRPQYLEQILKDLPLSIDENVIVGTGTSDDAAVYRINKSTAIVQTVDFFTPIVDDPYYFGAIAAANSLSDIYAMGAKPLFALNIVGFPDNRLPIYVLKEILKGASDKAAEAGISILGGHTVEDIEPKFGMAITGMVHPDKVLTNATAKPGDVLILTKPIGTGIISTAVKRGIVKKNISLIARNVMLELNADAANLMSLFPVNACTDITGFGLLGHLKEMMEASGVGSIIYSSKVPIIEGVYELATAGAIPGGTRNNLDYVSANVKWDENIPEITKLILCDAQTSGGLLIAIPEAFGAGFIRKLNENHNKQAEIIGKIIETDETSTGIIQVINLK
jgi:cysteine desulfurase